MTLLELLKLLRKHLALVIVLPLVCMAVTAVVAWGILPNKYTASTSIYVLTRANTDTTAITNTDLSASQMLTNDAVELIQSDRVKSDAAQAVQLTSLDGYDIAVESSVSTRVITISVTSSSPESAAMVANSLAQTADTVAQEVMDVESINVIDVAKPAPNPSGPNRTLYVFVALLAGLFVAIALVVMMDMMNTKVRSSEEASELLGLPIIGRIPKLSR